MLERCKRKSAHSVYFVKCQDDLLSGLASEEREGSQGMSIQGRWLCCRCGVARCDRRRLSTGYGQVFTVLVVSGQIRVAGCPCSQRFATAFVSSETYVLSFSHCKPLHKVSSLQALSTVFHSINPSDNSPLSHSILLVETGCLPYWSFQLHISL